jgi:hypothetical protein
MDYISKLGAIPVFHTEEGFPGCMMRPFMAYLASKG